ncbi:enoyl-CoA hydratase/isomerase family protein [Frankia sp. CNm7]|uniref:Enoyl-CoA hydratase/isomerase family protein n=1 Tax=Frankia nepalensis TaxID=1836974 RepID=A0A937RE39_9ACTN|nr:enoyl-CoA hydratase/isomerase family protein [Frankia nepalensis]MBL7495297.1 enoyl-CoA hydratase/isomerase family protein [Frankia nepalensis]MBL7516316.1 enoyl-CoA hydratase/isomerase family protein [Frankia nepalensis]MBL7519688.1 enoyl-CoA hydratase/isomerase family protein [Frankia nepalensis]MBL7625764.1 enoyl-CoA hydratase/isomerase family protein [Frankia nepalensis]
MPQLERDEDVYVLDLGDSENRFTTEWLAAVNALLSEVEAADGPKALVTTAHGKIWSNGLDLDWLLANPDQANAYLGGVQALLARVLTLPFATVAAVQGHAFAGGAMLTLAHDHQVMRADRGYWCLPEADLRLPFSVGMTRLIVARLPVRTASAAMVTGRRYGGAEALTAGIVDAVAAAGVADPADARRAVLAAALDLARPLAGKASPALGTIKSRLYADAVAALLAENVAALADLPTG